MDKDQEPILLTADQTAHLLSASKSLVYRMIAEGKIPSVKIEGLIRIPLDDLRTWVEELKGTTHGS